MFTLNVVAAQANSSMMWRCRVHAVAATAPNAGRCRRTEVRKLSGARPLAAARAEGSVSLRKIAVLSSHIAARVVMCWIMAWLGRPRTGPAAGGSNRSGDVLIADLAAGLLADDVGDLLLGQQLMA